MSKAQAITRPRSLHPLALAGLLAAATIIALLILAAVARAEESIPRAAQGIAAELDGQLAERLGMLEGPAKGTTLILSTPVDLESMEQSCPLARLLGEELAAWFVKNGYRVREVRRTKSLMMEPGTGELALSRDLRFVDTRYVQSAVLLTGTYAQTSRNVRFNIRLLHAPTGEVLAMASNTIHITKETTQLLDDDAQSRAKRIRPSVRTVLGQVSVAERMEPAPTPRSPWNQGFKPLAGPGYAKDEPVVLDLTE